MRRTKSCLHQHYVRCNCQIPFSRTHTKKDREKAKMKRKKNRKSNYKNDAYSENSCLLFFANEISETKWKKQKQIFYGMNYNWDGTGVTCVPLYVMMAGLAIEHGAMVSVWVIGAPTYILANINHSTGTAVSSLSAFTVNQKIELRSLKSI